MTLVEKKIVTLGEKGSPMYFTAAQLKQAIAKYPQYKFEQINTGNTLPKNQHAYIIAK